MKELELLNSKFVYKADKGESWKILKTVTNKKARQVYGDCEDYSLTLLWLLSKKSLFKFWLNILSFRYVLWFCKYEDEFHVILKHKNKYVDNIQKKWIDKLPKQYTLLYPLIPPVVALKFLISKLFK